MSDIRLSIKLDTELSTKRCKPSEFLDSNQRLAFTTVHFMFHFMVYFILFYLFILFLIGNDNCTISLYSSQVRCKRY